MTIPLDLLDKKILMLLQQDSRITNAELARQLELSPPSMHTRLRRLQESGIIRQYATLLDREQAGFDMLCFISITLQMHTPEQVLHFKNAVKDMPEVLECYHLTGEFDYLLKVVVRNRKGLEDFVVNHLTPVKGIARIHTSLVLTPVKETTALPLLKDESEGLTDPTQST